MSVHNMLLITQLEGPSILIVKQKGPEQNNQSRRKLTLSMRLLP